jgi:ribonuclease HII
MIVVGIDEVGRGCWAGPLVVGAVILAKPIKGLKDSKKLSKLQREKLAAEIELRAPAFGLGWVTPAEIDKLGLTAAVRLAMQRALGQITISYDEIIIDGNYNFLADSPKARALIKADATELAVCAASIIAKVARDKFMCQQAAKFPGYGFEKHVGYGTRWHQAMLKELGVCDLHRLSYKPMKIITGLAS